MTVGPILRRGSLQRPIPCESAQHGPQARKARLRADEPCDAPVAEQLPREQAWLKTELGVDLAGDKLQQIRKMDDLSNLSDLAGLGRCASAA